MSGGGSLPGQSPYENPDYPHQRPFSRTINVWVPGGRSRLAVLDPTVHSVR